MKVRHLLLIGLYLVTRIYILIDRPRAFTEILYSYMPYAHLWASGVEPYLKQVFEYPPVTALWFYIPHLYDMGTLYKPGHLAYLQTYRLMMLMVDTGIFILIWCLLKKLAVPQKIMTVSLIYYTLATAKAHSFIYDSMDLVFTGAIALSVTAPILFKHKGLFLQWLGYFLGVGLKLLNAPLAVLYLVAHRKQPKRVLLMAGLAGLLVWGYPLLHYRSSLQVMLVYHEKRGLQIESFPSAIAQLINKFSNSENVVEVYKNYDITGPVSTRVQHVFNVIFPVGIVGFLFYGLKRLWYKPNNMMLLWLTEGFLLLLMFTGKVLSTPFLLWHIPLLAAFPYPSLKKQWPLLALSLGIVTLSMTKFPYTPIGIFSLDFFIHWLRALMFMGIFSLWMRLK